VAGVFSSRVCVFRAASSVGMPRSAAISLSTGSAPFLVDGVSLVYYAARTWGSDAVCPLYCIFKLESFLNDLLVHNDVILMWFPMVLERVLRGHEISPAVRFTANLIATHLRVLQQQASSCSTSPPSARYSLTHVELKNWKDLTEFARGTQNCVSCSARCSSHHRCYSNDLPRLASRADCEFTLRREHYGSGGIA